VDVKFSIDDLEAAKTVAWDGKINYSVQRKTIGLC
jgi:predicted RNA-binding protein with PUA-like domain